MNKQDILAQVKEWFENNEEAFCEVIEELDSYNGYLGDDRYYPMEELDEFYSNTEPTEILTRAYYGHDDETYTLNDDGTKNFSTSTFNPNREWFYFNGYGNLVSSDYKDYSYRLDNYFVDEVLENRYELPSVENYEELAELLDKAEDAEDEEYGKH